jgi:hypothetical protein
MRAGAIRVAMALYCKPAGAPMTEAATLSIRRNWRPLAVAAGAAGVLIAGTVALWAYYGTAVFYEVIAAGIAMCF